MVIEHRRKRLGRDVVVLDPANPVNGFNVLDGIETSIKKEDIVSIAHMLLSESARLESSTGSLFPESGTQFANRTVGACNAIARIFRAAQSAQPASNRF